MYEVYTTRCLYGNYWYAQVWCRVSGETIFTSSMFPSESEARRAAEGWISRRDGG